MLENQVLVQVLQVLSPCCSAPQGIPTLLMAAGSFDDVLAITGFSTCLGISFSKGLPPLFCSTPAGSSCRLFCRLDVDERPEGAVGGGGRGGGGPDPGSVPLLLPQQRPGELGLLLLLLLGAELDSELLWAGRRTWC